MGKMRRERHQYLHKKPLADAQPPECLDDGSIVTMATPREYQQQSGLGKTALAQANHLAMRCPTPAPGHFLPAHIDVAFALNRPAQYRAVVGPVASPTKTLCPPHRAAGPNADFPRGFSRFARSGAKAFLRHASADNSRPRRQPH